MFYDFLPKPFFALAPMDDVTDTVFRQMVDYTSPADLYFTEFVNVDGLQSIGRAKLLKKLQFASSEKKLVAQLWGLDPENFKAVASQIADGSMAKELGLPKGSNFVGVDLNMGCPAKGEVKNGACSALIQNRPLASEIIKATEAGLKGLLPLSVKTRLGYNEVDLSWHEFLLEHNVDALIIHGRTKKQMSKVPADWDVIGKIRELRDQISPQTMIVGNGDVLSRQQGIELASKYKLDGVMVGRGIFHDPFLFSGKSDWEHYPKEQRIDLYRKHVSLFAETWKHDERKVHTLNKFCKVYIQNFDGAKELREKLMNAQTTDELTSLLS